MPKPRSINQFNAITAFLQLAKAVTELRNNIAKITNLKTSLAINNQWARTFQMAYFWCYYPQQKRLWELCERTDQLELKLTKRFTQNVENVLKTFNLFCEWPIMCRLTTRPIIGIG